MVKLAIALFTLCLLVLFAASFLNRFLTETERTWTARYRWYSNVGAMLERFRAHRAKTPLFYSGVAQSYVLGARSHCYIAQSVPERDLATILEPFAKQVARQLPATNAAAEKREIFLRAVSDNISNPAIQECLESIPVWFYDSSPDDWPSLAHWIVYDEAVPKVGGRGGPPVSYLNRFTFSDRQIDMAERHLAGLLRQPSAISDGEKILQAFWQQAFEDLQRNPGGPPSFSVFSSGISVSTEDLLLIASPFLLLLQLLFLIYWEQVVHNHSMGPEATSPPAVFPVFASPSDPLLRPLPRSLSGWTERFVWLVFLYLPTTILGLAVLTRYDFVSIANYVDEGTVVALVLTRSVDPLSLFLDLLNLGCFALSVFATLAMTVPNATRRNCKSLGRVRKVQVLIFTLAVAVFWLWVCQDKLFRHLSLSARFGALQASGVILPFLRTPWIWLSVLIFSFGSVWIGALSASLWRGGIATRYYAAAWLLLMFALMMNVPTFRPYANP